MVPNMKKTHAAIIEECARTDRWTIFFLPIFFSLRIFTDFVFWYTIFSQKFNLHNFFLIIFHRNIFIEKVFTHYYSIEFFPTESEWLDVITNDKVIIFDLHVYIVSVWEKIITNQGYHTQVLNVSDSGAWRGLIWASSDIAAIHTQWQTTFAPSATQDVYHDCTHMGLPEKADLF